MMLFQMHLIRNHTSKGELFRLNDGRDIRLRTMEGSRSSLHFLTGKDKVKPKTLDPSTYECE